MNIHEYQAKQILQKFGIPIPEFFVISEMNEMEQLLNSRPINEAVLKVQVHAGGRGKAGGVKFAKNRQEIVSHAKELLGKRIVNEQTGPQGLVSNHLLVTHPVEITKEYYLAVVIDRKKSESVLIASPAGGMDIEEIARKKPQEILSFPIPTNGLKPYHLIRIAKFMGWKGVVATQGAKIITNLVRAFEETDAILIEINPLVETPTQVLIALDAKIVIDENALFRQELFRKFFDPTQVSSGEVKAREFELAYISLDGDIGCMVNGAGLAMATMDIIQYYGGRPANFLDVGGGASQEKVAEGFKIILSDPHVKAILINIFGGIMNCATLASGIIAAANQLQVNVPLVVRMEGTNVEEGRRLLRESNLPIIQANSLSEAAEKVVNARMGA